MCITEMLNVITLLLCPILSQKFNKHTYTINLTLSLPGYATLHTTHAPK